MRNHLVWVENYLNNRNSKEVVPKLELIEKILAKVSSGSDFVEININEQAERAKIVYKEEIEKAKLEREKDGNKDDD